MFGIPEHEELRRYRAAWWHWGAHDELRLDPDLAWRKRDAGVNATRRARRRNPHLRAPYALRDLTHPRWCRTHPKRQPVRAP